MIASAPGSPHRKSRCVTGVDLVTACVFCAGLLLGSDLPPRAGLSGDTGVSYATLSRRLDRTHGAFDVSDVTPKFVLVGVGEARPAAPGLGTGTPAAEWRARFAIGPSHDEQRFAFTDQTPVLTTGTGRYITFDALGRIPVGSADSVELGVERREHAITDFSSFVFEKPHVLFRQRSPRRAARRGRRMAPPLEDLEAAVSVRWVVRTADRERRHAVPLPRLAVRRRRRSAGAWALGRRGRRDLAWIPRCGRAQHAGRCGPHRPRRRAARVRPAEPVFRLGRSELFGRSASSASGCRSSPRGAGGRERGAAVRPALRLRPRRGVLGRARSPRLHDVAVGAGGARLGTPEAVTITDAAGTVLSTLPAPPRDLRRRAERSARPPELTFYVGRTSRSRSLT